MVQYEADIKEFLGSWQAQLSEIKYHLEQKYGAVNPNTLAFVLKKLIADGIIETEFIYRLKPTKEKNSNG